MRRGHQAVAGGEEARSGNPRSASESAMCSKIAKNPGRSTRFVFMENRQYSPIMGKLGNEWNVSDFAACKIKGAV